VYTGRQFFYYYYFLLLLNEPLFVHCWTSAFLLVVHRLCGVIEGRLSHFLPRWLRTGWQSAISQGKIPWNTPPWLGNEPGPRGGQTVSYPTKLSWLTWQAILRGKCGHYWWPQGQLLNLWVFVFLLLLSSCCWYKPGINTVVYNRSTSDLLSTQSINLGRSMWNASQFFIDLPEDVMWYSYKTFATNSAAFSFSPVN